MQNRTIFLLFSAILILLSISCEFPKIKALEDNALINFYEAQKQHNFGNFDSALVLYNKAISKEPQNPEFYYERGRVYYDLDSSKYALTDFDKAIKIF